MTRLIVSSAIPLKYPRDQPEGRPDERRERGFESGAIRRMSLEPARTLEKTSRPSRSVPKKCCVEGATPISGVWSKRGSYGVMCSPRTAHATQKRMIVGADDEGRAPQ